MPHDPTNNHLVRTAGGIFVMRCIMTLVILAWISYSVMPLIWDIANLWILQAYKQ